MMPETYPVTCHTDFVQSGGTFVVIHGQNQNGLVYVEKALEKGAQVIVIEQNVIIPSVLQKKIDQCGAVVKKVANSRAALACLSAEAAGYPAKKLKLIGVTGTKGKTTTVHILYHILVSAGYKVAHIGTVENRLSTLDVSFKTDLTTPQPDYLHQFFKLCVAHDIEYVVMETAAQAATFSKLETLSFEHMVFTNLDREHGELYPTMEDYFQAKASLMHLADSQNVLVNSDDIYGKRLKEENSSFRTFGSFSDEYCMSFYPQTAEQSFALNGKKISYGGSFPGRYNMYNVAVAVIIALQEGLSWSAIEKGLRVIPPLSGRFEEHVLPNGAKAVIDYAHTPGSFRALFSAARSLTDHLIVVFGAGGGKDHEKRPQMGKIAAECADVVIVTTDNPRLENPLSIAHDICSQLTSEEHKKIVTQLDRACAIKDAYRLSKKGTLILLLGKGPDEYQIIGANALPFSERAILRSL